MFNGDEEQSTNSAKPMTRLQKVLRVILTTLALLGLVGVVGFYLVGLGDIEMHATFAYDVSDPTLVFGDAPFVAVVTVVEDLGTVSDERTAYRAVVNTEMKGMLPEEIELTQDGFRRGKTTWSFPDFPLMDVGRTYVVALTIPAPQWNQERLQVLVLITGDRILNGPTAQVSDALTQSLQEGRRRNIPQTSLERRAEDLRAWLALHPGFKSPDA